MRNFVIFLAICAGAFYFYYFKTHQKTEPIADPVYGEVLTNITFKDRSLDIAFFLEAADEKDCHAKEQALEEGFVKGLGPLCRKAGCKTDKQECKKELPPRYAKLFDKQPGLLTYVSFSRGDKDEQEMRLIFWGVTTDESDTLCDEISKDFAKATKWKGKIECIRAAR